MLNGREKVGHSLDIDWKSISLSHHKNKRKTIYFGNQDQGKKKRWSGGHIYIRELSIIDGAFGCSIWDAAIIMARWIYANNSYFRGKTVHELGCGVGLPGLMAARFASKVYFTDYLKVLVDNVQYNINLNSNLDYDSESDDEEASRICTQNKKSVKNSCITGILDWDQVSEHSSGSSIDIPKVDILIGSELTYSPKSIIGLSNVVQRYLKPDGVFYEILSTDRDGVSSFIDRIKHLGFHVVVKKVPDVYLNFPGSTQRKEDYNFYTFRTEKTIHPNFE